MGFFPQAIKEANKVLFIPTTRKVTEGTNPLNNESNASSFIEL
jgi:hypothetical protein